MAIEGAPRLPDDRDKLTDASDVVESTPHVQPPDAWQQFKDRIFGPKPEVDPDKDSAEEDDDSEEDENENGEVTIVKGKSKTRRFRRALRGLIAQKAEIPEEENHRSVQEELMPNSPSFGDSVVEHDWRTDSEDNLISVEPGVTADSEASFRGHDELPEVSGSYDESEAEIGNASPPVEIDNPDEQQVFEPEETLPTSDNLPFVPAAPEDLRTILERQHHLRGEQASETGAIDRTTSSSGVIFESRSGGAPHRVERVVEHTDNTAGLLAVDLLNYGVAKHRDKKINKAAIARDKDLDVRMQKGDRALEEKMLQQQRVQRELERQLQKKEHALPKIRHSAEFPLPADTNRDKNTKKVVENTTQESIDNLFPRYTQNFETRSTIEKPIVAIPDIALPSAETIQHKVETAAEKGVPIETEYELRHERKGNNDFSTIEEAEGAVEKQLLQANQTLQRLSTLENAKSDRHTERKADDYKQAVASGAWGAVVGVLLFVAYIMLTK